VREANAVNWVRPVKSALTVLLTSRPSQNSASVICPVMTRSLCRAPSSGLSLSTFFLNSKSCPASPPISAGVPRASLAATDAALEVAGLGVTRGSFGAVTGTPGVPGTLVAGVLSSSSLFFAIIAVISSLNRSHSWIATGRGDVNVNL